MKIWTHYTQVCVHVEARGRHWGSPSVSLHLIFWGKVFLNLELTHSSSLASRWAAGICSLSLPGDRIMESCCMAGFSHWFQGSKHIPKLTQHRLYRQGYFPCPNLALFFFLKVILIPSQNSPCCSKTLIFGILPNSINALQMEFWDFFQKTAWVERLTLSVMGIFRDR